MVFWCLGNCSTFLEHLFNTSNKTYLKVEDILLCVNFLIHILFYLFWEFHTVFTSFSPFPSSNSSHISPTFFLKIHGLLFFNYHCYTYIHMFINIIYGDDLALFCALSLISWYWIKLSIRLLFLNQTDSSLFNKH